MLNKNKLSKISSTATLIAFILINFLVVVSKPQQENESDLKRDFIRMDKVKPEQFAEHRDNTKNGIKTIIHRKARANYKLKIKPQEIVTEEEVASLGFTLWKFRKSEIDDEHKERIGTINGKVTNENILTPERVEGNPLKLEDGAKARFSVELPVKGYLYVFEREQYVDGSYSSPYLVYPVKGIDNLQDDNQIEISQPIYLPRQQETYVFTYNSEKGKILAEVYTFLVSPSRLGLSPIECLLSEGKVDVECPLQKVKKEEFDFETKLKEWGSYTEVSEFNLKDPIYNKYKTMDKAEIKSLNNKANKLTVKDPPPQKVYTIARKPTEPYMISIPIYYINTKQ